MNEIIYVLYKPSQGYFRFDDGWLWVQEFGLDSILTVAQYPSPFQQTHSVDLLTAILLISVCSERECVWNLLVIKLQLDKNQHFQHYRIINWKLNETY